MTATEVNGVAVLTSDPCPSPLGVNRKTGAPIMYTRIRCLGLADGTTVHGCTECEYTNPSMGSVRSHLKAHSTKPAGNGKAVGGGVSSICSPPKWSGSRRTGISGRPGHKRRNGRCGNYAKRWA